MLFTNPADVAKTRLNMDRELQSSHAGKARYNGTIACIRQLWHVEGMSGVQRGLSFAIVRELSKGVFRIGLHEPIMKVMHPEPGPASFSIKIIAGFASGAIAALLTNPLDLIKTRLQLEATHASGSSAAGAGSGPIAVLRSAVQREGLRSLWAGTQVSVLRSMLANGAVLSVNTELNERVRQSTRLQPSVATDAGCAFCAATAVVAAINPVDVVRTRLYSQPRDPRSATGALYTNATDCARKMLRVEGASAFYKGVTAHFFRVGPHVVLTFVFISSMKRMAGIR